MNVRIALDVMKGASAADVAVSILSLVNHTFHSQCQGGPMTPYETARNRLIPHATRHADNVAGKKPWKGRAKWEKRWNRIYLAEMTRLVKFTRIVD